MSKTTTNSDSFDKKTVIQPKQPRKNNMQSSISLGTDINTMKTTNQMNYTSTRNVNKQNVVYETKEDRSDSNGLRDGTIAVTTMKVTTVLSNDKKQGPQPPEIIKTSKQTRVHEETNKTLSKSNIVNQTNVINESNIVNQIDTVDTKSIQMHNDSRSSTASNITNRQSSAINENSNIKNRSSNILNTSTSTINQNTNINNRCTNILNTGVNGQYIESSTTKNRSSNIMTNQQSAINDNINMKNRSSDILNTGGNTMECKTTSRSTNVINDGAANGHTIDSKTTSSSRSSNVIHDGGMTVTRTSKTESTSSNIKNRSSDILNTENRSTGMTTGSSSNIKNRSSDILNSGQSMESSHQKRVMSTTSQADKINSQLNLRGNSSIENRSSNNNIIHSDSQFRSTNNITHCAVHSSTNNTAMTSNKSTINSEQKRDYVNSNASSDQKQHHRKNILSSREDVNNSVFHRKDAIVTNSNEAVHSNSLSTAAAIQRKSISNLHDQALFTSSNRKSHSTLHRNEKEIERSGQNWSHSHNLTVGGDFYGKSESKNYGNFSGHNRNERVVTKRTANQSSIVLGDGVTSGASFYKREYVKVHEGPCPAAHIDKGTFQHTRDTKTHKFYSRR